jgi:hypothetical protein
VEPLFLLAVLAATVLLALASAKGVLALILHLMSDTPTVHLAFSAPRPASSALPLSEHVQV